MTVRPPDLDVPTAVRGLLAVGAALTRAGSAALAVRVAEGWVTVASSADGPGTAGPELPSSPDDAARDLRVPVVTGDGVERSLVVLDVRADGPRERAALGDLAAAVGQLLRDARGVAVRRTSRGWEVDGDPRPADDLHEAMALADLLARGVDQPAPGRPRRPAAAEDETARLAAAVGQLDHALRARVVVEQAIGVLAERRSTSPRVAFETLRGAARSRGAKVRDLAAAVVASTEATTGTAPPAALPPELR